jgi:hypothetical protein
MRSVLSTKTVRLLLALTVSVWMAGGCLFGCSTTAMAANAVVEGHHSSSQTIVAGASCHAAKQPKGGYNFAPAPRGTMKDCPLAVGDSAVTSKNSNHLPDPGSAPVAVLPFAEKQTATSNDFLVIPYLPNRGPTYLRCCVFLI